jgi:hypothetical protein
VPNITVIIIGGEELKGGAKMTSMRGGSEREIGLHIFLIDFGG